MRKSVGPPTTLGALGFWGVGRVRRRKERSVKGSNVLYGLVLVFGSEKTTAAAAATAAKENRVSGRPTRSPIASQRRETIQRTVADPSQKATDREAYKALAWLSWPWDGAGPRLPVGTGRDSADHGRQAVVSSPVSVRGRLYVYLPES